MAEDYLSSLTEQQKQILDDAPDRVVELLMKYTNRNGMMEFFNLRRKDKLTGEESFERFEGIDAVNAIDYLKYLMRNGYKTDQANAI